LYFLKCKPKSFEILQTCCKIHAIFLKTCQSILHLQITHVYKITRTQNFKTKFKHTKHLKFAKSFLPNIRECVGETVRKSEIILEAFRNGGIVVTTGGAWTHMPLPVKQKISGSNISPLPPCICTGSDIHHHLQSKENTQTVAFTFVTYIYDTKSGWQWIILRMF
jgi:hypothetical protein